MRIFSFLTCFGLFLFGNVWGQKSVTDSLESVLTDATLEDSVRLQVLNTLAASWKDLDNNKAYRFAEEAMILSEKVSDRENLALALEQLGWITYRRGNYRLSLDYALKAIDLYEGLNDTAGKGRVLMNIGAIHVEEEQAQMAIDRFKEAYQLGIKTTDSVLMARSLNNMAYGYVMSGDLTTAHEKASQAFAIAQELDNIYLTGFSLRTLADIFLKKNEVRKAEQHLNDALRAAGRANNNFLKLTVAHRLGKLHLSQNRPDKAIDVLESHIPIGEEFGYLDELDKLYKLVADAYAVTGPLTKAFAYQSKYVAVHDSLYRKKRSEETSLMQWRFDREMQQAKIDLLTKEALLKEQELHSQKLWRYFYMGFASLLIILAFILFYENRIKSRAKRELELKNAEVNVQALQLKSLNQTKDKLLSIISHDLRSPVASLKALMELLVTTDLSQEQFTDISRSLKKNVDTVYEDLDNVLAWAQTQLKGIQSHAETIDVANLVDDQIRLYDETARTKGVKLVKDTPETAFIYADKNHVRIILRNLIANAIKFNRPGGAITISAKEQGAHTVVSVADSGVGMGTEDLARLFDPHTHFTKRGTSNEKGMGLGLLLVKEFVENNGGKIWVTSELGKGTTFSFSMSTRYVEELA